MEKFKDTPGKQALYSSINHWIRMIDHTLNYGSWDQWWMDFELGESYGHSCSLCHFYHILHHCMDCPLSMINKNCNNPGSLWKKVLQSKTREEWLENATNMLTTLIALINYEV